MNNMKKLFAAATLVLAPLSLATESAMNQALTLWQQQVKQYEDAVKNAPSDDVRAGLTPPDGRDIAPKLWQAINGRTGTRKNEKGIESIPTFEFEKNWALPGVVWILEHPQAFTAAFNEDEQEQLNYFSAAIISAIQRVHYRNPAAGTLAPSISLSASVRDYEILRKIYEKNTNKEARAAAALGMSLMLNNPIITSVEGSEAMARAKRLYYLKQSLLLGSKDSMFGQQSLVDVALDQAYFLRHLAVGAIAPLIKLQDAQGATHQFPTPGKHTLLLYWSPGNHISVDMLRDADKFKAQYPDVEICPIMPYCTTEEQQEVLENLEISQSYLDDANGSAVNTYRIASLPSAILIDKQCRIVYGGAPDMKLQTALESICPRKPLTPKAKQTKVTPEQKKAPVVQPRPAPAAPAAAKEDSVPGLREMPEF